MSLLVLLSGDILFAVHSSLLSYCLWMCLLQCLIAVLRTAMTVLLYLCWVCDCEVYWRFCEKGLSAYKMCHAYVENLWNSLRKEKKNSKFAVRMKWSLMIVTFAVLTVRVITQKTKKTICYPYFLSAIRLSVRHGTFGNHWGIFWWIIERNRPTRWLRTVMHYRKYTAKIIYSHRAKLLA